MVTNSSWVCGSRLTAPPFMATTSTVRRPGPQPASAANISQAMAMYLADSRKVSNGSTRTGKTSVYSFHVFCDLCCAL